jgi:hypothetical protein
MRSRVQIVLGSLVGAVAIHASFLACGSSAGSATKGSDAGPIDAMLDVISQWVDSATKDARAGEETTAGRADARPPRRLLRRRIRLN